MIATRPIATHPIAVKRLSDWIEPINFEGDLCQVSQTAGILFSGDLAVVTQSVVMNINYSGDLCGVSQSVAANYAGDLTAVSQSVTSAQQQYPFSADVAFDDFGKFGLRIVCDGLEVPICDYMNNIQITFDRC